MLLAQTGDDLDSWGFTLGPIGCDANNEYCSIYSTNIYQGVGVVVP